MSETRLRGERVDKKERKEIVRQFGFSCDTCCGLLPMPNDWKNDWVVSTNYPGIPSSDSDSTPPPHRNSTVR